MSHFARKAFLKEKKAKSVSIRVSDRVISYTDRNILYHDVMVKVTEMMKKRLIGIGKKKKKAEKMSKFMLKQWKERVGDLIFQTYSLRDLGQKKEHKAPSSEILQKTAKTNKYLDGLGIPETLDELPNPFEEKTEPIGPINDSDLAIPTNPFLISKVKEEDCEDFLDFNQEEDQELDFYFQDEGKKKKKLEENVAVAQYQRIQRIGSTDTFVCHLHHGVISVLDGHERKEVVFKECGPVSLTFSR